MWRIRICVLAAAAGTLAAQHEYTQSDIDNGAQVYTNNCIYCHGPEGNQIAGIDFGHGKFRKAYADSDLIEIIQKGIPDTGMPAQNLRDRDVGSVVAYIRSLSAMPVSKLAASGNADRGKAVFEGKGACITCHRVRDKGSRLGPNLSDIGMQRRSADLEQSLLDPNAAILPENRFYRVVPKNGAAVTGRILNQDTFTIAIMDPQERLRSFSKTDLREFAPVKTSPMPSYKDKLSSQELGDVLAYLVSLKGI